MNLKTVDLQAGLVFEKKVPANAKSRFVCVTRKLPIQFFGELGERAGRAPFALAQVDPVVFANTHHIDLDLGIPVLAEVFPKDVLILIGGGEAFLASFSNRDPK